MACCCATGFLMTGCHADHSHVFMHLPRALLQRPYLSQVIIAPHVYPPSISMAQQETQASPVQTAAHQQCQSRDMQRCTAKAGQPPRPLLGRPPEAARCHGRASASC